MSAKERLPAVDGWFTLDADDPHLLGSRCTSCGSYFFPRAAGPCRNPSCDGVELEEVQLGNRGTVWSFTTNHYPPPAPYVAPDPFVPYSVAAVELPDEQIVVLGQVAGPGDALEVGAEVELVLDTLYEDAEHEYVVWKWRPV